MFEKKKKTLCNIMGCTDISLIFVSADSQLVYGNQLLADRVTSTNGSGQDSMDATLAQHAVALTTSSVLLTQL